MKVSFFKCGTPINESEEKAFTHVKTRLQSETGDEEWFILTNLELSVTTQLQSDEIDMIIIGPHGLRVFEIKHWTGSWMDENKNILQHEITRLQRKTRKVATTLRKGFPDLPFVQGIILLTQETSKIKKFDGTEMQGVHFYGLNNWREAVGIGLSKILSPEDQRRMVKILASRQFEITEGRIRRLAGYINLELLTPKEERFHRVFKCYHPSRRDRVILHLYDLSSSDEKNAEVKAKREFEALRHLQLYNWAPRTIDSYQAVPGYDGELFFFTLIDPSAPNIEDRSSDNAWSSEARVQFAKNALKALEELHTFNMPDQPIIHRNITPKTILVKQDYYPIFTGFEKSRIPYEQSIASSSFPSDDNIFAAPEVKTNGFAVADQRSDVFSLCASLKCLFEENEDELSIKAMEILSFGLENEPDKRMTLEELIKKFSELLGESVPQPSLPPARYWSEDQVVSFHGRTYKIILKLGSGGIGTTFKVVEIDNSTGEEFGTYVAKVVHDHENGERVLRAYSLARSHLRHTALSSIFEVANKWSDNNFIALMTWHEGTPLADFRGVFALLAEELQETSPEALVLRWIRVLCEALDVLHKNGLVHGDVSPRNMIVSGSDIVLTDYDFITKIGEPIKAPGTIIYCAPSYDEGRPASPSDDIYALAASFFHVVFDKEPFRYYNELDKKKGLNWEGIDVTEYPILEAFLNRATHPEPSKRFANVTEALKELDRLIIDKKSSYDEKDQAIKYVEEVQEVHIEQKILPTIELFEARNEWVRNVLQSYPGSLLGNKETRGLDSKFAEETYVSTSLEKTLLHDIKERKVRLVVLCGNAGDGKTALLQHLAMELGLGHHLSAARIIEGKTDDGLIVRINLDGSAAWQDRSADDILDEFMDPFQFGPPADDIVHLIAINDGRLLEWIEHIESKLNQETPLTQDLNSFLQEEIVTRKNHILFINLNQRSLVGGIVDVAKHIETKFLDNLINQLYGGENASNIWALCQSCTAKDRCQIFQTARIFGPENIPDAINSNTRLRARERLFEALQSVHLLGETHITIRELRAALVYILFGIHFCDHYHSENDIKVFPYWDRAFDANSPNRQGEVLNELIKFDPALETHPQIDRYLQSKMLIDDTKTAPRYPELSIESARRRAFFEWLQQDIEQVAGDPDALGLAHGQHLRLFKELPFLTDEERKELCAKICTGISRLEDLPPKAFQRPNVVPLRITPRTPTETAFWVEKPFSSFRLHAGLPVDTGLVERLHRKVYLIYKYRDGREERLRMGAELFHLLLELSDGYQLGDVTTEDTFAHLSIFVQRLVREDERELFAWNPMKDDTIYRIFAETRYVDGEPQQKIIITPLS
mgnify:FL=1